MANQGDDAARQPDPTTAFRQLDPHQLLDAIDAGGWHTDGRVSALNSYENRVYAVGLDDGDTVIAKFYRPGRWSDAAILEEHAFCRQLVEHDLPVIAPIEDSTGNTLFHAGPFRFCLFPKTGGRPPELDNSEQLLVIGRTLGRLHLVGETARFTARPQIDAKRLGDESVDFLEQADLVPPELRTAYLSLARSLLESVHARLDSVADASTLRIHGDFHPGNLLWGADGTPRLFDFDDCGTGPAVQDLWMFISGDRQYAQARLGDLLDGYTEFREFDERELVLIEALRTLRILHYAAWIGRRWEDPAFEQAFPFFATARFWDEHILSLREQQSALQEPPLIY